MALDVRTTEMGRKLLAAVREQLGSAVVAVDYDGTLAPIVTDPAKAVPGPGAVNALGQLSRKVLALVLITGRPAQQVVEIGGFEKIPNFVVLGMYGAERWSARGLVPAPTPDGLIEAREELARLIAAFPGAYIEDKGASIAAHTRPTRDPAAALAQLEPKVQAIGQRHHLSLEPGRFVLELRAPGVNKGHTLEGYVAEVGAKAVIFIGDDLGDLPAFDAVRRLRASGLTAIAVASASAEAPEVAAAADAVVEGPTGVVRLLRWLAGQDDPNNGGDTKRD